jgi:cytochrome c oxidase assembly protein subunit 15
MNRTDAQAQTPTALVPVITSGFAIAVAMWCAWVVLHHPSVGFEPAVSGPILLALQIVAATVAGWGLARGRSLRAAVLLTAAAGGVASAVNLASFGSMLVPQADPSAGMVAEGAPTLNDRPPLAMMLAGYFLASVIAAAVGGLAGAAARRDGANQMAWSDREWLARLGWIALAATLPLLLLGGLTTSTQSGLAVPDWPGTYGGNMFVYPISLMASNQHVFLEHSHRLFGTLVGMTTLALMVLTLLREPRMWVKWWAVGVFSLVCAQGILGGLRVTEQSTAKAILHGVLAQIVFAMIAALAAYLSQAYRAPVPAPDERDRRRRVFATGLLHLLFLQLTFGAMYRHAGHVHALYSHIALSFVVMIFGCFAGMLAAWRPLSESSSASRTIRRAGTFVLVVICLQFALGWAALLAAPPKKDRTVPTHDQLHTIQPVDPWKPLVRTAHQANGALLLAGAAFLAVHVRRFPRR